MNANRFLRTTSLLLLLGIVTAVGCGDSKSAALQSFKEMNESHVAKVRTCFELFYSRKDRSPNDQAELVEFLTSGKVDKILKRIELTSDNVESIFTSERDNQPLKIRWGMKMDPDLPMPIAFESEGVDGIRLVAADVVLKVDNDKEYEDLWKGKYVSETEKKRRGQINEN